MGVWNQNAGYGQRFINSLPFTSGKVFIVAQTTCPNYDVLADLFPVDPDGDVRLHSTIQSAHDAAVANRDDYIIVVPDSNDYDVDATITISKARLHIIAPAGLGHQGFPSNAVRLHQTGDYFMFTVTADTVEIAGFFMKLYEGKGAITYAATTRWHQHIHDNFFGSADTDASDSSVIYGTAANNHYSIHDNYFTNYTPGAVTGTDNDLGYFINFSSDSCTRGLIKNNYLTTGVNTEVTVGIQALGVDIIVDGNVFQESIAGSGTQDGVFTKGIATSVGSMVLRNYFAMDGANEVSGGTTDESYVQNFESTSGGTVVT